jgi:guanylate kinase
MYHKKAPTSVTVTHRSQQQGENNGRKINFFKKYSDHFVGIMV